LSPLFHEIVRRKGKGKKRKERKRLTVPGAKKKERGGGGGVRPNSFVSYRRAERRGRLPTIAKIGEKKEMADGGKSRSAFHSSADNVLEERERGKKKACRTSHGKRAEDC